ncbi:hypothetical protein [Clostridioides difficile]
MSVGNVLLIIKDINILPVRNALSAIKRYKYMLAINKLSAIKYINSFHL